MTAQEMCPCGGWAGKTCTHDKNPRGRDHSVNQNYHPRSKSVAAPGWAQRSGATERARPADPAVFDVAATLIATDSGGDCGGE